MQQGCKETILFSYNHYFGHHGAIGRIFRTESADPAIGFRRNDLATSARASSHILVNAARNARDNEKESERSVEWDMAKNLRHRADAFESLSGLDILDCDFAHLQCSGLRIFGGNFHSLQSVESFVHARNSSATLAFWMVKDDDSFHRPENETSRAAKSNECVDPIDFSLRSVWL